MVDVYRTGTWVRRGAAALLALEASVAFAIAFFADQESEAPRGEAAQLVTFGAFLTVALLAVVGASELWRDRALGVAISSICFGAVATLGLVISFSTKEATAIVSTVLNGSAMIGVLATPRMPGRRRNRGPSNNAAVEASAGEGASPPNSLLDEPRRK